MNARQSGHTPATPVGKAGGVGGGGGGGSATVAASVLAAAAHRAATAHALSASGGRSPAAHAAFGVRTPTPRTIRLDPDSDVDELVAAPVTPRAKTPARLVVAPISASAFAARTPVRLPARGDRPPTPEMRLPRSREPPAGIKRPRDAAASPTLLPPPLGARSAPPRASVLTAALSTSRTKRVIALDDDDDDADGFKEGAFNSLSGGRGGYAASVPKSPSSTGARVKRQRRLASIDLDREGGDDLTLPIAPRSAARMQPQSLPTASKAAAPAAAAAVARAAEPLQLQAVGPKTPSRSEPRVLRSATASSTPLHSASAAAAATTPSHAVQSRTATPMTRARTSAVAAAPVTPAKDETTKAKLLRHPATASKATSRSAQTLKQISTPAPPSTPVLIDDDSIDEDEDASGDSGDDAQVAVVVETPSKSARLATTLKSTPLAAKQPAPAVLSTPALPEKSAVSAAASTVRRPRSALVRRAVDKSQLAANVRRARNAIMRRITAGVQTLPQLDGAEAEAVKAESMLFDLLRQTVMQGQGNSVILCGPRDSGKTTILRSALCRLKAAVESKLDDTSDNKRAFIEVHLNGLAHTDDRSALRSIIKQLRLESTFEGHAVTSFSDTLAHILGIMSSGNVNSTPIVFVLDEFEHFAQHAKQVLLYNLFDTAQKRENPIAVVGLACGLDSVELLEKRVKSRFSHRMIHVRHPRLDTLRRTVRALVTLSPADDGISDAAFVEAFNDAVESALEDPRVAAALDAAAELDRSMGSVLQGALTCIASLSPLSPFPCADALVQHLTAASPALADHALTSTRNASVLELCMLVACKHLLARQVSMFNFEMAYDEYREFARQAANMGRGGNLVFAKRVALKAFENLVEMRLLRACEGVASCCPKEYRMFRCIITRAQIEKSVLAARDICPEAVVAWGTRR
ncbi:origin recognition complex subunit 4 [Polyrhizophydium stewartii]|uniref:Origin recognition complex subunit 4 n=1 Tax=Polyrhizophydium stewartii TaxID=2732419 RepID=A0ABR4NAT4_9FUNG